LRDEPGLIKNKKALRKPGGLMKKWFFIIFVCVMPVVCAGPAPADEKSGVLTQEGGTPEAGIAEGKRIIAKVNGVEISERSLLKTEDIIRAQNLKAHRGSEDREVRKEALERLILQELIYQKAVEMGMKVDEKELDPYVERIRTNAGGEEAYLEFLSKEKLSEKDLRKETERHLLIQGLYNQEVAAKVVVSEEEMRAEYERNKDKFVIPEKIVIDDVIFFLDPEDSSALKKAEEVLKVLRDEKKEPSELESDGTFVVREITNPRGVNLPLVEAARKLSEGELSGVIKSGGNIHIIKLKTYSQEKQFGFDDVKRLIENNLKEEARKKRLEEWRSELRKNARIEILLKGADEK
jgi:parvulin-like peptidyl-prolyl isomerase